MVVIPSFTQTANALSGCNDYGCYDDDGKFEFYPIPVNPPAADPWDWSGGYTDPNPPTCDYLGDPDCDNFGASGGSGGGSSTPSYNPIVCNQILATSPNVPGQPQICNSDPGGTDQLNYSQFITDNLGNILGLSGTPECAGSLTDGCYWSNQFPYMTEELARSSINIFGDAYFRSLDYLSARSGIFYVLTRPCESTLYYSNLYNYGTVDERIQEYNSCVLSQATFLFLLAPATSPAIAGWTGSFGFSSSFGPSISINFDTSTPAVNNWMADLLIKIEADRRCHTYYQALDAANCPNP